MPNSDSEQENISADNRNENERKKLDTLTFNYQHLVKDGEIIFLLEGIEVFRATFSPDNYAEFFFKLLKPDEQFLTISEDQRRRLYAGLREASAKEGREISDEELRGLEQKGLRFYALQSIKQGVEAATKRVVENLPNIVAMIIEKVVYTTIYAARNELSDILEAPKLKFSAKEIHDALLQPEWERLKSIAVATPGGARNIKHIWTDEERECLAANYGRLKPIWVEAKRIAKHAQKSKEPTRSHRWREEVKRAYPDLPSELIERLAIPRSDDAKPADIALTHAASLCLPVSYTTRRLRTELKAWKVKNLS